MKLIKILTILYFLSSNNAYAYVDPVTITSLLSLLFAAVLSSLYLIKLKILNFLKKLFFFFRDLSLLIKFLNKKKKIVFFFEHEAYEKYLIEIINQFIEKNEVHNLDVLIFFNKENYNNSKVKYWQFNTKFFLYIALNTINCNLLVTTTPDLNISSFKKSKHCRCYFYVFHSLVSTQMIYKKNAFNNFDVIACATKYQKLELIRYQENSNNQILELGYPFLTYLKKKKFVIEKKNYVLIAPSWIDSNYNFYKKYYYDLIKVILNNNIDVIFRPHPESFKRHKNYIFDLENDFKKFNNFKIDILNNFSVVCNANYLVTDWSGIAFEYMYLTKKAVIYFEIEKKINNIDIKNKLDLQNQMIEVNQREKLGLIINSPNEILNAINKITNNSNAFSTEIDKFFKSNIYNYLDSDIEIFKVLLEKNKYYESKSKLI